MSALTVPAPSHPAAAAANHQRRRREEEHDLSTARTANTHTRQGTHKAYIASVSLLFLSPSRRQPKLPRSSLLPLSTATIIKSTGTNVRMKGGLFTFALWGVLFALVPFAVDYATRKEFPVHSSGAIIVTGTCV